MQLPESIETKIQRFINSKKEELKRLNKTEEECIILTAHKEFILRASVENMILDEVPEEKILERLV